MQFASPSDMAEAVAFVKQSLRDLGRDRHLLQLNGALFAKMIELSYEYAGHEDFMAAAAPALKHLQSLAETLRTAEFQLKQFAGEQRRAAAAFAESDARRAAEYAEARRLRS